MTAESARLWGRSSLRIALRRTSRSLRVISSNMARKASTTVTILLSGAEASACCARVVITEVIDQFVFSNRFLTLSLSRKRKRPPQL